MLKHYFLVYEKHDMIIFSFETLGSMHKKHVFFLLFKFFCILEVLMKTRYFNTGFCILFRDKIKTDIKQNYIENTRENCKIPKNIC